MSKTFKFYQDRGHGWIAVKISLLEELGIDNKISACSYKKGQTAYLEEDCDASLFVSAYEEKFSHPPAFIDVYHDYSPIRSYQPYKDFVRDAEGFAVG